MLEVKELCYEVNGRKIIHNLSLFAKRGQLLAIVGANGAGKSTLLSLLNAENKPSEGMVTIDGQSVADIDTVELARMRATLAQSHHVNLAFSVEEVVMMGRFPHEGLSTRENDQRIVAETIRICGLKDMAERSYLQLSGGEQQRVHLARVLAQIWDQPQAILFLDEPVAGLDMRYQQQTLAIAKALSRKGMMVIAVLHDLNLVADYADRVLMLKDGRRWKYGTPIEVLNTLDIYHVFDVETEIKVDPKTLSPFVLTKPMKIDHHELNVTP